MWEIRLRKAIRKGGAKKLQAYRIRVLMRAIRGISKSRADEILQRVGISKNSIIARRGQIKEKREWEKGERGEINKSLIEVVERGEKKDKRNNKIEKQLKGNSEWKKLKQAKERREKWMGWDQVREIKEKPSNVKLQIKLKNLKGWEQMTEGWEGAEYREVQSRHLQRLYEGLTQLRKGSEIDDNLRIKIKGQILKKVKLNTWSGNRHKRGLPQKGRTINRYNSRKRWKL